MPIPASLNLLFFFKTLLENPNGWPLTFCVTVDMFSRGGSSPFVIQLLASNVVSRASLIISSEIACQYVSIKRKRELLLLFRLK